MTKIENTPKTLLVWGDKDRVVVTQQGAEPGVPDGNAPMLYYPTARKGVLQDLLKAADARGVRFVTVQFDMSRASRAGITRLDNKPLIRLFGQDVVRRFGEEDVVLYFRGPRGVEVTREGATIGMPDIGSPILLYTHQRLVTFDRLVDAARYYGLLVVEMTASFGRSQDAGKTVVENKALVAVFDRDTVAKVHKENRRQRESEKRARGPRPGSDIPPTAYATSRQPSPVVYSEQGTRLQPEDPGGNAGDGDYTIDPWIFGDGVQEDWYSTYR